MNMKEEKLKQITVTGILEDEIIINAQSVTWNGNPL